MPKRPRTALRGLPRHELEQWLKRHHPGIPAFRSQQIFGWMHRHDVHSFDEMRNVPKAVRASLERHGALPGLSLDLAQRARDGTVKLRLRTEDEHAIESVLIPNAERGFTQCISSQVGCAVDCQFCATASMGLVRNLAAWEIVDQVRVARRHLRGEAESAQAPWPGRITNLVFMGMGEPLHNFNALRDAIDILTDSQSPPLSARRITVSSSGLVPAIERFGREGLHRKVGLAVSLNATTDEVRDAIMPINRRWNIQAMLNALRSLPEGARRDLTFEYVLLRDINDTDADAARLVKLLREFHCHVNLIPFNPHPHASYQPPSNTRMNRFRDICKRGGLGCYLRRPRGEDIDAACGQLALSPSSPL